MNPAEPFADAPGGQQNERERNRVKKGEGKSAAAGEDPGESDHLSQKNGRADQPGGRFEKNRKHRGAAIAVFEPGAEAVADRFRERIRPKMADKGTRHERGGFLNLGFVDRQGIEASA